MATRRRAHSYCCDRFGECVREGSIHYCGKRDETEWAVQGFYHLYYCPFCGTAVKGTGWGAVSPKKRRQPNKRLERSGMTARADAKPPRAGRSASGR